MRKSKSVAPALTSEQVAALLALLAAAPASTPAPEAKPRKAKAKPSGDAIVASAGGFTFAWTHEKTKKSGTQQYRLVITRGRKTLTRGAGYPYPVDEAKGTLVERLAGGVPKFAMGLATSLAK
jgi:hypothetical protein